MTGLKRGTVVELRSGGPEMTIERIDTRYGLPDRFAWCQWFDKMRLRSGIFPLHSLDVPKPKAGADVDPGHGDAAGLQEARADGVGR